MLSQQSAEVALAKAIITLALNEFEKDRADYGFREYLKQDTGFTAVHDPPMPTIAGTESVLSVPS